MRISIVGMQFAKAEAFVATLPVGAPLVLQREPDNKFDKNAVAVYSGSRKIGYLPKTQNGPVAAFLDKHAQLPLLAGDAAMIGTATLARSPNSGYPMADFTLEQSNVERAATTGPAGGPAAEASQAEGGTQEGGERKAGEG